MKKYIKSEDIEIKECLDKIISLANPLCIPSADYTRPEVRQDLNNVIERLGNKGIDLKLYKSINNTETFNKIIACKHYFTIENSDIYEKYNIRIPEWKRRFQNILDWFVKQAWKIVIGVVIMIIGTWICKEFNLLNNL